MNLARPFLKVFLLHFSLFQSSRVLKRTLYDVYFELETDNCEEREKKILTDVTVHYRP